MLKSATARCAFFVAVLGAIACGPARTELATFNDAVSSVDDSADQDKVATYNLVRCPGSRLTVRWDIKSQRPVRLRADVTGVSSSGAPVENKVFDEGLTLEQLTDERATDNPEAIVAPSTIPSTMTVTYKVSATTKTGEFVRTTPDDTDVDEVRTVTASDKFSRQAFRQNDSDPTKWVGVFPEPTWDPRLIATNIRLQIPQNISAQDRASMKVQVDKGVDVSLVLSESNSFSAALQTPVPVSGSWVFSAMVDEHKTLRKNEELTFTVELTCR